MTHTVFRACGPEPEDRNHQKQGLKGSSRLRESTPQNLPVEWTDCCSRESRTVGNVERNICLWLWRDGEAGQRLLCRDGCVLLNSRSFLFKNFFHVFENFKDVLIFI